MQKTYKLPFWLVADLEAYITPIDGVDAENDDDDDDVCGMRPIDEHRVSGFCCYRVTSHPAYETEPFVYSGPNVLDVFYDHVLREAQLINAIVADDQDMMPMTSTERSQYEEATHCGNCGIEFTNRNHKVRHHDHISGQYQIACCNKCNLQLKAVRRGGRSKNKKKDNNENKGKNKRGYQSNQQYAKDHYEDHFFLPLIMHNLKNYDAHHIIKAFHRKYTEHTGTDGKPSYDDVKVIARNAEKFMQIEIGELRFLDSYQFLSASLDELVSLLLKSGKHNFVHTQKHLGTDDDLVFSKGVYPYSYMTGPEKFQETQLPPIESFYDKLKDESLKEEDYQRAKDTWSRFGIKTMKGYHDHYLLTDVLLLADVFQHFREAVYSEHGLDCLQYVTLPSLAWQMALKHTKVELELLTDPEAYLMIENNLRGGIATISQRHASANNPYVSDFDDTAERQYISYLDCNSLYATAQSEPLPVGNFRFLTVEEISRFRLEEVEPDSHVGYIIECDLEYPTHLHKEHNNYPMAPEHLTVTRDMLSPFALNLLDADPSRPWVPTQKLVPNLLDKSKYVTHYKNLQLYVKHGLKVTKIHRVLSFSQQPWLKNWIDLCNKQRREAKSDFHSDLQNCRQMPHLGKRWSKFGTDATSVSLRIRQNSEKPSAKRRTESQIINPELVMVKGARNKVPNPGGVLHLGDK